MRKLLRTLIAEGLTLVHLVWHIRQENLKLRGIPGDADEANVITVSKDQELFVDKLKLPNGNDVTFQRCHRLR